MFLMLKYKMYLITIKKTLDLQAVDFLETLFSVCNNSSGHPLVQLIL